MHLVDVHAECCANVKLPRAVRSGAAVAQWRPTGKTTLANCAAARGDLEMRAEMSYVSRAGSPGKIAGWISLGVVC